MKFLASLLLLFASVAQAQNPVPLEIVGETILIVQKLPFQVKAPPDGDLYFWTHPANVKATDLDNRLEISEAPKGSFKVSVKVLTVTFDGKKIVKEIRKGDITVNYGGVEPPPPPDPVDAFVTALETAFAADGKPGAYLDQLAAAYRLAPKVIQDSATKGEVISKMHATIQALMPDATLAKLRRAIADELNNRLGRVDATLNDVERAKMTTEFARVEASLGKVRK